MPDTEQKKAPSENLLTISQPLEEALLVGAGIVKSRGPLGVADLLWVISETEGLGRRALTVVGKGNYSLEELRTALGHIRESDSASKQEGYLVVRGKNIPVTSTLASLIQSAKQSAIRDAYVDTGHIVLSELESVDSVLKDALSRVTKSSVPVAGVVSQFIHLTREKNSRVEMASNEPIQVPRSPVAERVVDLLKNAQSGAYEGSFINPEWTLALIQSVENNSVTMLMTEHEDEVTMAMQGLARELSSHTSSYINIQRVVAPDPTRLVEDPDGAIAEAVQEASGGVLILPGDARYLLHKAVRLALRQQTVRVVSYVSQDSWPKVKSTLEQLKARELYLSPPNKDLVYSILKAQKKALETRYSVPTSTTPGLSLTLSDDAIRQAAKLGYQYASVMDMSATLAAYRILDAAVTNIKVAHSGMNGLLKRAIKLDKTIDTDDVYEALKTITGIEVQPEDPKRYLQMEKELGKQIIGQDEAIAIVSETVRRSETALRDPRRPRGVFMFLGPSGVGKTELAKVLNEFVFGDDRSFKQLNMSEYQEQHAVARLIGAPPGYVGYEEGGQLTEWVRKQPYSILVIDEMEKAHPKVFDIFLQVFEEGKLTDGKDRAVDFTNTIIIMTGNIGSENFAHIEASGFDAVKEEVLREAETVYRPEFLNRIDSIIVFKPLSREAIAPIVDLQIKKLNDRLKDSNIHIKLTPSAHAFLEKVGYDPKFGARPLRRAVEKHIGNQLTPKLLTRELASGDTMVVDYQNGQILLARQTKV